MFALFYLKANRGPGCYYYYLYYLLLFVQYYYIFTARSAAPQTTLRGGPRLKIEPGTGGLEAGTLPVTTRPPHLLLDFLVRVNVNIAGCMVAEPGWVGDMVITRIKETYLPTYRYRRFT